MTAPLRVLVVDDERPALEDLAHLLRTAPGIADVETASSGEDALQALGRRTYDALFLDVRMPGLDGLEVTRQLAPHTRVVVVTTFDGDEVLERALDLGACGFLTKDSSPGLLVEAVRSAARGDVLVSPQVVSRVLRRSVPPVPSAEADVLTPRELEVVRHVARGLGNNEIAAAMRVSVSSVKAHLASVQGKVGARNRVEIVTWAFRAHVVAG